MSDRASFYEALCRRCNLGKSNTDETDWRYVVAVDARGAFEELE